MRPDLLNIALLAPQLEARFTRSGGPGGQNVNKLNTRVTLLFDFQTCPHLTPIQKSRIRNELSSRLSRDGRVRVVSRKDRTQIGNRALAEQRLLELLREALKTRKQRRPTRPSAASRKRRLKEKRRRGETKRDRALRPSVDD